MSKRRIDENQLDLFAQGTKEVESVVPAPVAAQPFIENPVVVAAEPVIAKVEVVEPKSVQTFLKEKEVEVESVKPVMVEVVGQVKMTENEFIMSIPDENRFVSLSMHSDMVIITPIPEDGSLNLKLMKEQYPTFVTQVQKINDLGDQFANIEFLDKLKDLADGKKKAGKTLDSKEVEAEINFIDKLESGEIEEEDEKPVVTSKVSKPKI